ncbi:methionine ABC transporter ATP-binding protein [Scrofimicrobium sp. R131]|uniref:ATP-binding cassette domain-containing protein n=1 Tax=Scrofimicrobium appendicitidis TaxID=3079930 RepID=A0AAU7V6K5_9ACTO
MISLVDVSKIYQMPGGSNVVALDNVSLEVEQGAIHGIVGQSGAGKSTLIRCLTALERPTSGQVLVDGFDMAALSRSQLRDARRRIGMVFQQANLLDARTAAANIGYPLKIARQPADQIKARVEELLGLVGLAGRGDSYPAQLSGGQQQRVGIARGMASNPPVLLCDEPTSALDQESTDQILTLLKELRDASGVTVVIITHQMSVVTEICDSVTLLQNGRVVQSGSVDQVLSDVGSPLSEALIPPPSVEDADLRPGTKLLDVAFTSRPGVPTGATMLNLIASMGGDIASGRFESIGELQVGRLAVSVPAYSAASIIEELRRNNVAVEERTQ